VLVQQELPDPARVVVVDAANAYWSMCALCQPDLVLLHAPNASEICALAPRIGLHLGAEQRDPGSKRSSTKKSRSAFECGTSVYRAESFLARPWTEHYTVTAPLGNPAGIPGAGISFAQLEADLALDDLAQAEILGRQFSSDQPAAIAAADLLHAAGNHVDEHVRVRNDLQASLM